MSQDQERAHQQRARAAFLEALLYDDPVQLYERAPCGFLSTTPEGLVVKANATFRTWLGKSSSDLIGRVSFVDLLAPGSRIYHETHYAPTLFMHGSVQEVALDLVTAEGRRLPVLVNATLDRDEDGAPAVIRVAVFDATERRRYERELLRAKEQAEDSEARARELARTLQESLIPPTPAAIPGLDVAAAYRPAGQGLEVGGDFFDVFPVGPDAWVVVVGDVCGKGAGAAVVAGLVRHTVRALTVQESSPARVLGRVDEVLRRHESDRFCSVVLAMLHRDGTAWRVVVGNAGHPAPLLLRGGGPPRAFGGLGALLGVFESDELAGGVAQDSDLLLAAGDTLVFHTDGVTDARRGPDLFGEERLSALLTTGGGTAEALVDRLVDAVVGFQSGDVSDDIAVVALRVPEATGPGGLAARGTQDG